jgi:ADP-heptose:LPS heptosyltransferase
VVGDDSWPTHLAAAIGVRTVMLRASPADWLWGPRTGPSPWYPSLEVLDDADQLAMRLQGP